MQEDEKEPLVIGRGGLYSAFPIPAYKILVAAGEHVAKDVLLCLVSHLGKSGRKAFPSISHIMREASRSRSSVIAGVRTLEEFGFIKKFQFWDGNKKRRSIYYLQDACWNNDRMNRHAIAFAPVVGRCGCGAAVKLGEIGLGKHSYHHYGCGDVVTLLSTRKKSTLKIEEVVESRDKKVG